MWHHLKIVLLQIYSVKMSQTGVKSKFDPIWPVSLKKGELRHKYTERRKGGSQGGGHVMEKVSVSEGPVEILWHQYWKRHRRTIPKRLHRTQSHWHSDFRFWVFEIVRESVSITVSHQPLYHRSPKNLNTWSSASKCLVIIHCCYTFTGTNFKVI